MPGLHHGGLTSRAVAPVIKRTVEISQQPVALSVHLNQLVLRHDGHTLRSIPCEDVGVLLVDHPAAHYTHAALAALAESGAVVVLCGRDHLPAALVTPLSTHSNVVTRIAEQLAAPRPMQKQLWKQLVQAKIRAQANNLPDDSAAAKKLRDLACIVRSGDPNNVEAQAARVYWQNWLTDDEQFRRERRADGVNSLLNYGYAVMRAAVARAIVAAGLLPAVGLHHHHRANAFCLADDLIEPLRPIVDRRARDLYRQGFDELTPPVKAGLLPMLDDRVEIAGEQGPLMVSLHRMVGSLIRCYRRETRRLEIPVQC